MWPNPQFPVDLVIFTEEILNGKLHFSCSVSKVTSNSATLKAATLNSGASLINEELFLQLNIVAVVMCCFATAQQSAQHFAQ